MTFIHSSAQISTKAQIGEASEIGPFSIIHGNVIIGKNVKIGAFCELGIANLQGPRSPLVIGDNSLIRSHSTFYESSSFESELITGHYVTVRENSHCGKGFQIGTQSEIQGDCKIGNYVKFQSNVFVGKKTIIGNFVRISPYVTLTNDPTPPSNTLLGCIIGDYAVISAASVILPGVKVGSHSLVAAKACVLKDVPKETVVGGVPAKVLGKTTDIKLRDGSNRPAYPWNKHFTRNYPKEILKEWSDTKSKEGL